MKKILLTLLFVMLAFPVFIADASENGTSEAQYFAADASVGLQNITPNYSLTFHDELEEIARLDFEGDELIFQGDAIKAARIFMDYYYWENSSDNHEYRLYLENGNNLKATITFTTESIEYGGNFTVSSEADQFFKAVLNELQKRKKFK